MGSRSVVLAVVVVAQLVVHATVVAPRVATGATCATTGTPTTTVYLPNITKTLGGPTGWVTPFIVQNVGTAATTLEVSFYRFSDGGLVTCRSYLGILPGTSFADVPNNDTDLPGDSQFSVVVRSFGAQVVAVVNEHQGAGSRAESLSYVGLTSGATRVGLPWIAKSVSGWLTTFVVQNLGTATAAVSISFSNEDGTRTASFTRTIAPGRSAVVDPSVEPGLIAGTSYAALLTSDQPIGVVANAHNDAPTVAQPMAFSFNGAPPGAGDVYLPWVGRNADGGRYSTVVVQNLGTSDASPTLTFRRVGGTEQVAIPLSPVKAGRATQYVLPVASPTCPAGGSASCPREGEHSLVVSGGPFAVLGYAVGVASAMSVVGGPTAPTRAYLPNITRTLGGAAGWTTPIVLQSAGPTSAILRWYRFADGSLAATQYVPGLSTGGSVRVDPRSVSGLADGAQYAVIADASGPLRAVVLELSGSGGDGAMAYEGFAAMGALTPAPALTSIALTPATTGLTFGQTQQLTATVKDQFGNAVTGVPLTWTVEPSTIGAVTASGLFAAGQVQGTGSVRVAFGALAATATISVQPKTVTVGGFTFNVRASALADVHTELPISSADAQTIVTTVDADVAAIQTSYGRSFASRAPIYTFLSRQAYTIGIQTVLGVPAAKAAVIGGQTSGVVHVDPSGVKVGLNWEEIRDESPITTIRHELTHVMIDQIANPQKDGDLPAWLNEGSARLEEFTVTGAAYWAMRNRFAAVSMVSLNLALPVAELTSQEQWNLRTGDPGITQYFEASRVVQLLRDDVGKAGVNRIFEVLGQGAPFESAFTTVAGRPFSTFSSTALQRLRALAVAPGVATALDTPEGPGLSFMAYGFAPSSSVTITINGGGYVPTVITRTTNSYGTYNSYLDSEWRPGTYTFIVTAGAISVTSTAVKTASAAEQFSADDAGGDVFRVPPRLREYREMQR